MPTDGTWLLLLLRIKPSAVQSVAGRSEGTIRTGPNYFLHHKSLYCITPAQKRREIKSVACVFYPKSAFSFSQSGGVLGNTVGAAGRFTKYALRHIQENVSREALTP